MIKATPNPIEAQENADGVFNEIMIFLRDPEVEAALDRIFQTLASADTVNEAREYLHDHSPPSMAVF